MTLDKLLELVRDHVKAHPDDGDVIAEVAYTAAVQFEPLPANAQIFKDAREWYETLRTKACGQKVDSADWAPGRVIGYSVGDELLCVYLPSFKEGLPKSVQGLMKTPNLRKEFSKPLFLGTAPALE